MEPLEKFEAHLIKGGDVEIRILSRRHTFLLDTEDGYEFGKNLIREVERLHPTVLKAVEQKIKQGNRSLYATMKLHKTIYVDRVCHTICSCCFGEDDEHPDFDGTRFNMEYPRQCRDAKYCPWNGYEERNKDSFMVICGAKREYGFTPQERRVVLNLQGGITNLDVMADVMCLTKASIYKFMTKIHEKTGVKTLPELINLLKDTRI